MDREDDRRHRQVMQDRVPQARLFKAWNIPEYGAPDQTYLSMAFDILGSGKTSRLYKRLVYKDRIASTSRRSWTIAKSPASSLLMISAQPAAILLPSSACRKKS
jgi:zinc protease